MKEVEVRCPDCNKMLFKVIDDRYIELPCTRCDNEKLIFDLLNLKKDKELTKIKFAGRIIIG